MRVCIQCAEGKGCNESASNNLLLMPIKKIAAWQLLFSNDSDLQENYQRVMLPALQRGAVWKPKQVEFLWDSLMRGFPTGSFLFAPFNENLGVKKAKHDSEEESIKNNDRHHFHLLDGQQRANAIALGFLDPWIKKSKDEKWPPAMLWIDLSPDKIPSRKFGFRVITRSHPWGYRLNNPEEKLGAAIYRHAIESYKKANKYKTGLVFKSGKLALTNAWPWDAVAPVPFCFLVESVSKAKKENGEIDSNIVRVELKRLIESLPFWGNWNEWKNDQVSVNKQTAVEKAIKEINPNLLKSVAKMLDGSIPALVMNIDEQDAQKQSNDTIEELFIRVNAGGTKLEGEELIYSILKSVMPGVHEMVEKLETKIMAPSRLVSLAIRVYEARQQGNNNKNENPPDIPSVVSFRKLIQKDRDGLTQFMESDDIKELLTRVKDILNFNKDYGLPPIIVTDMARNSADFVFYLLVWLDIHKGVEPNRKALLGLLTTLHWFSVDKGRCLRKLWPHLKNPTVWETPVLSELVHLDSKDQDRRLLLLPVPPETLCKSIKAILETIDENLWKKNRWEFRTELVNNENSALMKWVNEQNVLSGDDHRKEGVKQLIDRLLDQKGLLLYAQRDYIVGNFSDYDPSSLDQQDDSARPWDYDHIHPSFYIYGKWYIPQLIKTLHSTNGNYRAWPMEDNRSDQEDCPKCKLLRKNYPEQNPLTDSFINQNSWDNYWTKSLPAHGQDECGKIEDNGYLANNDKYTQEEPFALFCKP